MNPLRSSVSVSYATALICGTHVAPPPPSTCLLLLSGASWERARLIRRPSTHGLPNLNKKGWELNLSHLQAKCPCGGL